MLHGVQKSIIVSLKVYRPTVSKADAVLEREQYFYRVFSIVKYSFLSRDTFKTFVEMHVTSRKLTY